MDGPILDGTKTMPNFEKSDSRCSQNMEIRPEKDINPAFLLTNGMIEKAVVEAGKRVSCIG